MKITRTLKQMETVEKQDSDVEKSGIDFNQLE